MLRFLAKSVIVLAIMWGVADVLTFGPLSVWIARKLVEWGGKEKGPNDCPEPHCTSYKGHGGMHYDGPVRWTNWEDREKRVIWVGPTQRGKSFLGEVLN